MYDFQSPVCWSNSPNVPWVAIYLVGTVHRALVSLAPQRVHNVGRTRIMAMHTNIYTTKNAKSTCTITQLSITLRKALQKSITHAYTKHTVMQVTTLWQNLQRRHNSNQGTKCLFPVHPPCEISVSAVGSSVSFAAEFWQLLILPVRFLRLHSNSQ